MKKFLSFFIVVAVVTYFVACSVEMDYNPNYEKPVLKNPYVVSIPQAIDRLNAMFPNSVTATRSRVSEVITLSRKDFGLITRSSTSSDAPLIYIVPTDNNGCAVMGADSRMTPLYALLENTTLTAEDFLNIDTRANNEAEDAEIKEFIAGLLYDAAIEDIEHPIIPWDSTPPDPDFDLVPIIKSIDSLTESHETYLATKWNQSDAHIIKKLPASMQGKAGCVTIAIAQICYHKKHPQQIKNVTFNWSKISSFEYNNLSLPKDTNSIANFISQIAQQVYTTSSEEGTGGTFEKAFNFFQTFYQPCGYLTAPCNYNEETAVYMISRNNPVYIRGRNSASNYGHAWVLDGYRKYEEFKINLQNGDIQKSDSVCNYYFHCNFGAKGQYDGYYLSRAFNITNRLSPQYIVESIGDIVGFSANTNANFNDGFLIIFYDKQ